jgi:hypothetical protein
LTSSTLSCPTELSLYSDEPPSEKILIANECERLRIAFPTIQREFIGVLVQMVLKKGMSKNQLIDSIDNILMNYKYPHPTVADVIGFDKRVKLYTHAEVVADIPKGFEFNDYDMISINEQKRWIRK